MIGWYSSSHVYEEVGTIVPLLFIRIFHKLKRYIFIVPNFFYKHKLLTCLGSPKNYDIMYNNNRVQFSRQETAFHESFQI